MENTKRIGKRALSLLCALVLLIGILPVPTARAAGAPNLVTNPGFDGSSGWTFTGDNKAGVNGDYFWLAADGSISQEINVASASTYCLSAVLSAGVQYDGKEVSVTLGVRYKDGDVIKEKIMSAPFSSQQVELDPFEIPANSTVEVYVQGGGDHDWDWVNGDDVKLWDTNYVDPAPDYSGNLLTNPSFDSNMDGWTLSGAGRQTNNPYTAPGGFYLDYGAGCYIEQSVTAPYTGWYTASAYINTSNDGSQFALYNDTAETSAVLDLGTVDYSAPHTVRLEAEQGDTLRIRVRGGAYWTNGDDLSLIYDFSQVGYNLLTGWDQTDTQVRLPWSDGKYVFSADIAAETETTVTVDSQTTTVPAGESRTVTVTVEGKKTDDLVAVSLTGSCTAANVSLTWDYSGIPNTAPTAVGVTAENASDPGVIHTGQTLTGSYTFQDADAGLPGGEGVSTYRWLTADAADGTYTAIDGETQKTLALTDELAGKYIRFEVTPVDGFGLAGRPVCSEAVGPVIINYIRNPSLDIESSGQPVGWGTENGGEMPNNKSAARTGFRLAWIPYGDADAAVFYSLTVPETARYTAGVWVRNYSQGGGVFGVRMKSSHEILYSTVLPASEAYWDYMFVELPNIALEAGSEVEVFIMGGADAAWIDADDFQLLYQDKEDLPSFVTLHSFAVKGQSDCVMDSETHTIEVTVPYGTSLTDLEVTAQVSEGAVISPASGSKVDFSNGPVTFTITNGESEAEWTVNCTVDKKRVTLVSDNQTLQDGFNWAAKKTDQYVMTGQTGPINKNESYYTGETAEYIPSYWAGYYHRSAFYSRDFVHQAAGAQIVGLSDENFNMFKTFAMNATEGRDWYTCWAFNFDGSIFDLDYANDDWFVREVPSQFELVEKAYEAYLWSGDSRYIEDEDLWNFYTEVMTDFVTLHDTNGNGVAEGTGGGIFQGTCTYNEMPGEYDLESGDAIGSQYQATLAYASMLRERGDEEAAQEWFDKADALKAYFNEAWSVKEDGSGNYVRAIDLDGVKYDDFGCENSWFMPMKLITEPGERTDAYLDYIMEQVGDSFGDQPGMHRNVEAWTYLPDTFFPYNRANDAWKYMKYIIETKDEIHQVVPAQGTNGDYPEVSFTLVSQTVEGMMGVEPDAANHKVVTAARLPDEVGYVEAKYITMGDHSLNLTHDGLTKSILTNDSEYDLTWEARFYGAYDYIKVDGAAVKAEQKDVNGVTVSYVTVQVSAGGTVVCEAAGQVTVTFASKGGSEVESQTVFAGDPVARPANPVRSGYTFTGWYVDSACTEAYDFSQPVTGNMTLYAGWSRNSASSSQTTPTAPAEVEKAPFRDVKEQDWYFDAVNYVYDCGLMNGVGDSRFDPDGLVTRAMVWTVLARMDGVNTSGGDTWYAKAQAWAMDKGVSDGTNPMNHVTREQLAAMLYRFAGSPAVSGGLSAYPDGDKVSDWARDGMLWAVENGIITGMGDGSLAPQATATRAQMAAILMRFTELLNRV